MFLYINGFSLVRYLTVIINLSSHAYKQIDGDYRGAVGQRFTKN